MKPAAAKAGVEMLPKPRTAKAVANNFSFIRRALQQPTVKVNQTTSTLTTLTRPTREHCRLQAAAPELILVFLRGAATAKGRRRQRLGSTAELSPSGDPLARAHLHPGQDRHAVWAGQHQGVGAGVRAGERA